MRIRIWYGVVYTLLVAPCALYAQSADEGRKQAVAMQVESGSVRLDGRLDDEVWIRAVPITDFQQAEPAEGATPTDVMEVRFLYDDAALMVGARMSSRNSASIQAPMSRRDEGIDQAERIFVSLDTYLDHRTAYTFGVTAAGVRFDHFHASDNRSSRDRSFDPIWEARVSSDADGWTAELRIPFQQLRFAAAEEQVFGLNVFRGVPTRNEEVYWSLVRRTERLWASRFGELHGIRGVGPARRIELLPYVAGSSTLNGSVDADNPFDGGSNLQGRAGADMKFGLGPNVTLEATVNPDFGQVEADPAEVNLSAFETFFDERRPFFLEGSGLLGADGGGNSFDDDGDGAQFFYTRRIGASPVGDASGDFVDYPATSTILGAAKITGRLASGTSLGFLAAVTGQEFARTYAVGTRAFERTHVAPMTMYGVGRVQQEFGSAGSTAALMMTATHRDLAPGSPLASLMPRNALTASGDSNLRFRDGEYELGVNIGVSHVAGDASAIGLLQRSSARYFQRPDVSYISYDPAATSMGGARGTISAERAEGRHWLWQVDAGFVTPGFEVNDLGRLSTADTISGSAELEYRETEPGRLFRNYSIGLEHDRQWNFGGSLQESSFGADAEVTLPNFWSTEAGIEVAQAAEDFRLTRGGPTMGTPGGWSTSLMMRNSSAAATRGNLRFEYGRNQDKGSEFEINAGVTLRPAPRWQLSFSPSYEREVNDQQFVTAFDDGPAATFGRRYVFAYVDRTTVSSEIRLNYAFRPDVNLEFYGEPFAASGRYYDFGSLIEPGGRARLPLVREPGETSSPVTVSDGTTRLTFRNRDFNVLSFRSNVVLRWEWRPGSTMYVVWQQDREESEVRPTRVGFSDLFGSFGAAGTNVIAIKTTFWLGGR